MLLFRLPDFAEIGRYEPASAGKSFGIFGYLAGGCLVRFRH
jgi:hypothetical protein